MKLPFVEYKGLWYRYDTEQDSWIVADTEDATGRVERYNVNIYRIDEALAQFNEQINKSAENDNI